MLHTLAKLYDEAGLLVGVAYTLFEGNPQSITAVGLRFEAASAVFRAITKDDTLAASLGTLRPEPGEVVIDVGRASPWSVCLGSGVCWGWRLTNQLGYTDGVRLEFCEPGGSHVVIELVVVASAIQVFVAVAATSPAEPVTAPDGDERS